MYQVIWSIFAEIVGWNRPKFTPNRCVENSTSWESWDTLSNYVFLWINYTSKSYALETVETGLKNSSFNTLLTLVVKALYALSLQICTSLRFWKVRKIKKIQKFGHLVWKCDVNTLTFSEKLPLIRFQGSFNNHYRLSIFFICSTPSKTGHF